MPLIDEDRCRPSSPCGSCDHCGTGEANSTPSGFRFDLAADVEPEQIHWIWKGRIPAGKLTIIDGDPGVGKSTISDDIAARVSTGTPMPGEEVATIPASNVLLFCAEDGTADTVVPRLRAARADLRRIRIVHTSLAVDEDGSTYERFPEFPLDLERLATLIRTTDSKLVVLDVFVAYLGGVKAQNDQDMRRVMSPLAQLAEETGCAFVLLRHFRKSDRSSPLMAGGGSVGIVGAARVGMFVALDPDDDTEDVNDRHRLLAVAKCNVARVAQPFAYRLIEVPEEGATRVEWLGETDHETDSLLTRGDEDEDQRTERQQRTEMLADLLASGPVAQPEVMKQLGPKSSYGWSTKQLRSAFSRLGGVTRKRGGNFGGNPGWYWSMPVNETAEDDLSASEDTEGDVF